MSSGHHISADAPRGDSKRFTLLGNWTGSWRGGVLLVLLCLSVLLPGFFTLPPFDRDEPRFAQASRQMWQTGDWIVPRVQDRPRLNKPPLIYWLQAGSAKLFGAHEEDITTPDMAAQGRTPTRVHDAIWMYRVPGALCTIASVLLTWAFGKRLFDSRAAWLGAAMLAICPLVVIDAHQARADQLLLTTIIATQWALWNVLTSPRLSTRWFCRCIVLGACTGVSILAKGPVAPLVASLTAVSWIIARNGLRFYAWKNVVLPAMFGTLIVSLVAVIIALPWVLAVASTVGYGNYTAVVFDETIGRAGEAKEGHSLFPGFHLVALVALFFPGSMLAGAGVIDFFRRGWIPLREVDGPGPLWRGKDSELFVLCWLLPTWLVFELISTRLPHYVMPLYPALALIAARVTLRASAGSFSPMSQVVTRIGLVVWSCVGALALGGGTMLLAWYATDKSREPFGPLWLLPVGITVGVVSFGLCIAAGWFALKSKPLRALLLSGIATVIAFGTILHVLGPRNPKLWPARNVVEAIRSVDPALSRPIGAIGFHEDSMIFLSEGKTVRISSPGIVDYEDARLWLKQHPDGLLILRTDLQYLTENVEKYASIQPLKVVCKSSGFRINGGKWEDLIVVGVSEEK